MANPVGNTPPVTPQGTVDHRMRAPGSGYQGGPTAITPKGPPADLGTGHLEAPKPPTQHVGRFANTKA